MRVQHFREDVDHVWHVHVLLLVICATTIYLTVAPWTSTRDVLSELSDFQRALDSIRAGDTQVESLARLQRGLALRSRRSFENAIHSIDAAVGIEPALEQPMRRLFWVDRFGGLEREEAPFDVEREALESVVLEAREIARLTSAGGLRTWVDEVREHGFEEVEVAGLEPDDPVDLELSVNVEFAATDRDGILPKQQKTFVLEFQLARAQAWSLHDFWVLFPRVQDWFEQCQLGGETLSVAITAASVALTSELQDDLVLGPFRLQGEHLGFLGPCLVLLISVYIHLSARTLVVRLEGLPASVVTYVRTTSRWLPLRLAPEARLTALFSDLVLPAVAVGLPVWRLTSQPRGIAVVLAVLAVLLGWSTLAQFFVPREAPRERARSAETEPHAQTPVAELRQLDLSRPDSATTPRESEASARDSALAPSQESSS